MLKATPLRIGAAILTFAAGLSGAVAQGAGSAAGAAAASGPTGHDGGPVQDEGSSDRQSKEADGTTSKGVAGTGMGATTPAMRDDTSSIGGNGMSVQRPDHGSSGTGGSGGANAAKP